MRVLAMALFVVLAFDSISAQVSPPLKSANSASFTGKDVRRGANIWFFSTLKANGTAENETKIFFHNSRIRFSANGTQYSIAGPNGSITFSAAAEGSSTTFDAARNEYHTVVPLSFTGKVFLSGILFIVPEDVGLILRTGEAIWEGEFYSTSSELKVTWQWAARAYWGGTAEYQDISVEPTDASRNCADATNNWWYGKLCLPIGESKDRYLLVASSGASSVVPISAIPRAAPTAIARAPQRAQIGSLVQLDGTRSSSVTGEPLTYAWSFESTPDGKHPVLSNADSATPTFVPTQEGTYTLQLVVSDGGVRSPPSTVRFWSHVALSDKWTFSMPGSVLLFEDIYSELRLVEPGRSEIIQPWGRTRPSLSRDGNLVAWGFEVPDESARVVPLEVSLKSREYFETPLRPALALYVVPERKIRTLPMGRPKVRYGDIEDWVSDTAISPDGSRVAFTGCPTDCSKLSGIFLLEIATGNISPPLITNIPGHFDGKTTQFVGRRTVHSPSWSPNGARLAFQSDEDLAILDIESREVRIIANGKAPSWSPTGEWIAYLDESGESCLLIRPDGTGQRTLKKLGGVVRRDLTPWVSFSDSPVWSPDGKQLLLNMYMGETLHLAPINEVVLLDVATGNMKRMRKHALNIAGWANQKAK